MHPRDTVKGRKVDRGRGRGGEGRGRNITRMRKPPGARRIVTVLIFFRSFLSLPPSPSPAGGLWDPRVLPGGTQRRAPKLHVFAHVLISSGPSLSSTVPLCRACVFTRMRGACNKRASGRASTVAETETFFTMNLAGGGVRFPWTHTLAYTREKNANAIIHAFATLSLNEKLAFHCWRLSARARVCVREKEREREKPKYSLSLSLSGDSLGLTTP